MNGFFKKLGKGLKEVGKGLVKLGKVLLMIVVVVVAAIFSPKNTSMGGRGGSPRREDDEPSDVVVTNEQKPDDEVIDPSFPEPATNEYDNDERFNEPKDEDEDLPENSYLGDSWLNAQYKNDSTFSPLSLENVYEDKSKSFNSRYSLEIDYSSGLQKNSIDPKSLNNNTPEKQQTTSQNYSQSSTFKDALQIIALNKFVSGDTSSPQNIQQVKDLLEAKSIKIQNYSSSSHDYVTIEYTDKEGNNHVFFSSKDSKGNTTSSLFDLPSENQLLTHPLPGARVSSSFGPRTDPITKQSQKSHQGIDLVKPKGTPIIAASSGKVSYAGQQNGYGKIVIVDHGGGRQTASAHLDRINVKKGEVVSSGQKIGELGNSGTRSTGPHLHFEVREKGQKVDPKPYIYGR